MHAHHDQLTIRPCACACPTIRHGPPAAGYADRRIVDTHIRVYPRKYECVLPSSRRARQACAGAGSRSVLRRRAPSTRRRSAALAEFCSWAMARLTALMAVLLTGAAAAVGTSIGRRPNVITILTDDQGFGDNGYYCENSTALCALTPHMDYLATSPHSVIFHRFYSAAGVCSPTRAAILTGRTNQRDCIWSALTCDGENPAPTCSMGVDGSLPGTEFTTAKAARKAGLSTIHIGKCEPPLRFRFACGHWVQCLYLHYSIGGTTDISACFLAWVQGTLAICGTSSFPR